MPNRPYADRTADRIRGDVERLEQLLERRLVLDDVEHLREGHQADPFELLRDERVEVVAPQLAVGDDVTPEIVLAGDEGGDRLVGDAVELAPREPLTAPRALRVGQRRRPGPAADRRDGEQREGSKFEVQEKKRSDSTAAFSGPKPVVRPGSHAFRPSRSIISR